MLSARNIANGQVVFDDFRLIADADFEREHSRTRIAPGDVLLTIVGALGRSAVVPVGTEVFTLQRSVAVLKPRGVDPAFLSAQFQAPIIQDWIQSNAKGTAQRGIYLGALGELKVRVAPLNEQCRIVAKLETLQARSRRAREPLDAVPPLLEKLRQSILAAAFRGDLTKDWRANNKGVEPGSELLKRIRVERRKKWEETELAKMNAKGKAPTDERWKAKYTEPEPVNATGLPELPQGWCWATAEELTEASRSIIYGIIKAGPDFPGGVPYVRVTEVAAGRINLEELPRCDPERAAKFSRSVLAAGDILVSKDGTIGKVAFVPPELEGGNINQHVLRVAAGHAVDRFFLSRMIESPQCQRWMTGETKGIALQGVNVEDFRRMPIPLAPVSEQTAVVSAIETALGARRRVEEVTKAATTKLASLDRATLAKAFRGELVPQDSNDEPSAAMLARVLGPTGAQMNGASRGRGRKPTAVQERDRG
jgi:type I restriction enzyme S subunit